MARPPVTLDPKVQARLLQQMREEQSAAMLTRKIRNFFVIPFVVAVSLVGSVMAFSDDSTTAMLGNFFASSILTVVWMLRKRIAAAFE